MVFSKRPVPKPVRPLKVFPNPAREQANLELWTEGPTQATISLHNLSGKLLKQEVWNIEEGGLSQNTLQLADFPPGIFLVVVETAGSCYHSRLVKF